MARSPLHRTASLLLRLVAIIYVGHFPTERIVEGMLEDRVSPLGEFVIEAALLGAITGSLIYLLVVRPLRRSLEAESNERARREAELAAETLRQRFESRVNRGTEMATTEAQTLDVLRSVLGTLEEEVPAALLLADSSESHLKTVLDDSSSSGSTARTCAVEEPRSCPVIRGGTVQQFPDAAAVDACPHLRTGGGGSATCIPVTATGRAVGVLHVPGPPGQLPSPTTVASLETTITAVGRRLDLLRVMERTELQAATDSLTGLINRRSVEGVAADLLRQQVPMAVALADLDHFKRLNDTHGHELGDRALRLYAATLRGSMREADIVSRYGGEEFLVLMPDTDLATAAAVLQRSRVRLAAALERAQMPTFSASYGLVHSGGNDDLVELIRLADRALYRAKERGRDRVVMVDPDAAATDPFTVVAPSPGDRHLDDEVNAADVLDSLRT